MVATASYRLVTLANGARSVRSLVDDETFHPGIGPVAEAEALYVRQLRLPERARAACGDFVLWDVGLGAAANALTAIRLIHNHLIDHSAAARAARPLQRLRLVSFDRTCDALAFALQHTAELGYLTGYEDALAELTQRRRAAFGDGLLQVEWTLVLGDFPTSLSLSRDSRTEESERRSLIRRKVDLSPGAGSETGAPSALPAPHAILFDPHSPKANPDMWTVPLYANLFHRLDPRRPCALATFTRSTMARVAMLLGGFFVGAGHPSGLKEETTVAANRLTLLDQPLDCRWLEKVRRSDSAEPLWEPVYRRAPLSPATWEQLRRHPQFQSG
jgi:queuine tRNA-ribosyltransferase